VAVKVPSGVTVQPPAALVDRMMVPAAQQHQVGQVGGAAVQPMLKVVGVAPGQRPGTPREPAATIPDGQRGALGGGDDPGGAAHLQRFGSGAAQRRGQQAHGGLEPGG
jgi:hypothetical protein